MKRILSIDGGGMWGLPVAMLCAELERRLQMPLARKFDLSVGTSTGGLLALALACEIPANQLVRFYQESGPKIFRRQWWRPLRILAQAKYPAAELEKALRAAFGGKILRDAKHPVMVTSADLQTRRTKIFKSWADTVTPIWEAARATSAAPTFFEPIASLVDGGVWANNPAMVGLTEARQKWPGEKLEVLSLGTGQFYKPTKPHKTWGLIDWGPHIANLFLDTGFDAAIYMTYAWADRAYRCDFERAGNPAMDDASPKQMKILEAIGYDHCRRAKEVLDFLG